MARVHQLPPHSQAQKPRRRSGSVGGAGSWAWACCDYADTLLQRNGPGDRDKATSLLDESLAISSELGMRPLMERVLSRRGILGA